MGIPTHENKFVKSCLRCKREINDLQEDHVYCTKCASPLRNECTATDHFTDGEGVSFHSGDDIYILEPENAFCPKCGSESLFNQRGLIDVEYPRAEVVRQQVITSDEDLPF